MIDNIHPISLTEVVALAEKKKEKRFRLVGITAQACEQGLELIYHFDRGLALEHYRGQIALGEKIQSISSVFFSAVVFENEIQDQFGVGFTGLALDFEGSFLLNKETVTCPLGGSVAMERKN